MLDIKVIRDTPDLIKKIIADRHLEETVDVDSLLELDAKYKSLLQKVETHRALRNTLSDDIAKIDGDKRKKLIEEATEVKNELAQQEIELKVLRENIIKLQQLVPNLIASDVPVGVDETQNVVLRTWGEPTKFDFDARDHVELGEKLDLIDIETSALVSGSRFNYLKNDAVLLQFALASFVFESLTNQKVINELCELTGNKHTTLFTPVLPPVLVRGDVAKKMDRFDPIEDRYYYEEDDMMFVGSAEHSIGPMHMDKMLKENELPLRYIGYSTAFRREAGSYGKDTRGILRRHQFDKLEMESFALPEDGQKEQDLFVAIQEYFVQQLQIPHEVMILCTGDMGKPNFRQVDINCWLPGEDKYRETHSSDYMTDYQARRLNTRYKKIDGETGFVHMNDATALALGRILISIIENYQQQDGSVKIPKVLQKYMQGKKVIN